MPFNPSNLIDASLFAHIENDPELTGTVGLEGNSFIEPIKYLLHYFSTLSEDKKNKIYGSAIFIDLVKEMAAIEEAIKTIKAHPQEGNRDRSIQAMQENIANKILNLSLDQSLLMPGGWINVQGPGHAMVYQFTKIDTGYHFTVINSGAGLNYHEKKSGQNKELYHPLKTWFFQQPKTEEEQNELSFFIGRLLKTRIPQSRRHAYAITEEILYTQILASISHINGTEIKEKTIPDDMYTAGQLSGTCAQRCLHLMLKINSATKSNYQQFIFEFKQYAVEDYIHACTVGRVPYTTAVNQQIQLAIKNNLKILNTDQVFSSEEVNAHRQKIQKLQERLSQVPYHQIIPKTAMPSAVQHHHSVTLKSICKTAPQQRSVSLPPFIPLTILEKTVKCDLDKLEKIIDPLWLQSKLKVKSEQITSAKHCSIEKILSLLPIEIEEPFYADLVSLEQYQRLNVCISKMQIMLNDIRDCITAPSPTLNCMILCVVHLQMGIEDKIASELNLPSFKPLVENLMLYLLRANERNPFYATNNPELDKKIHLLQKHYSAKVLQFSDQQLLITFYQKLLNTNPQEKQQLEKLYDLHYTKITNKTQEFVREYNLQALFQLSNDRSNDQSLFSITFNDEDLVTHKVAQVSDLKTKISYYIQYEYKLKNAIELFFDTNLIRKTVIPSVALAKCSFISINEWGILSPLYGLHLELYPLSKKITVSKYSLLDNSSAHQSLMADFLSSALGYRTSADHSANGIQLSKSEDARVYFHLRSEPALQIFLTLDYFKQHIFILKNESSQRYVEANLFQPGLLLDAFKTDAFWPLYDTFLKEGFSFYTNHEQYLPEYLFFIRLDYLISRYQALGTDFPYNNNRLKNLHDQIIQALTLPKNTPAVTYVLQQYLFLTLMTRIELEPTENIGSLFEPTYRAYYYIQNHINPCILEDNEHRIMVEKTMAHFKTLIQSMPEHKRQEVIQQHILPRCKLQSAQFPVYTYSNGVSETITVDILWGKLIKDGLIRGELPIALQTHPLIIHLQLQNIKTCYLSQDGHYIKLENTDYNAYLFYENNQLTVQKDWCINGTKTSYELVPLTQEHLAAQANSEAPTPDVSLPKTLTDANMDLWQQTNKSLNTSLLVKNNLPLYLVSQNTTEFIVLNTEGQQTEYRLCPLQANFQLSIHSFESDKFIEVHRSKKDTIVRLPRYNLNFKTTTPDDTNPIFVHTETNERIVKINAIDPAVAGIMLESGDNEHKIHRRYLVPVARFYATAINAQSSDFYPVLHDTQGIIAQAMLDNSDKVSSSSSAKLLWNYQHSEKYISFIMQNDEPVADTIGDALYLAYLYLATHQPEKTWTILEKCTTWYAGLTGATDELQYIQWICNDVPHILPDFPQKDIMINTPPYVACKLKALSLLSDFYLQDRKFSLTTPPIDNTANSKYARLASDSLLSFQKQLPQTIFTTFSRFQSMDRNIPHLYKLSMNERFYLLDYYHQTQPRDHHPRGALGNAWVQLSYEKLLHERAILNAHKKTVSLSTADEERLQLINAHLKDTKRANAKSTVLEKVPINLSIPDPSEICTSRTVGKKDDVIHSFLFFDNGQLNYTKEELEALLIQLTSEIPEHIFITFFQALYQIAILRENKGQYERLVSFCRQTLIANRHIGMISADSDIPLLCNILYRISQLQDPQAFINKQTTSHISEFDILLIKARLLIPEAITVYQSKDIYGEILTNTTDIEKQNTYDDTPLINPSLTNTGLLTQPKVKQILDACSHEEQVKFINLTSQYLQLHQSGSTKILDQITDESAGQKIMALEKSQTAYARGILDDEQSYSLFSKGIEQIINTEESFFQDAQYSWREALKLAQQGPSNIEEKTKWDIEIEAESRSVIDRTALFSMYRRASTAYTIERTGLSAEQARQLHHLIHQALLADIHHQLLKNIRSNFKKIAPSVGGRDTSTIYMMTILDILTRKEIPGLDKTATVIIQHETEILLRSRQISAIQSLLKSPENKGTIEKVIPGGGKSKVILPVVAEELAQGTNLVVIEVPAALLETNYVDFSRTSQRLFGKHPYRFDFNRDSNSSAERFEKLYRDFRDVMRTRQYLVTTGEAMQSLELKYIELLRLKERNLDWEKQIFWCDRILKLLHTNANCIIDEIHQGLSIKKKLNYTSGDLSPISPKLIQYAITLFQCIELDFIKKASVLPLDFDWELFKADLAGKLVSAVESPLYQFYQQASLSTDGYDIKSELISYICGKCTAIPQAITTASAEEKEMIAFYKRQVSSLLVQTLCRKLYIHYGPSKRLNRSPVELTLAIPYQANGIPNEKNRFSDTLESINLTIQMMLIQGVSAQLFTAEMIHWQKLADLYLKQPQYQNDINKTPIAIKFALLDQSNTSFKFSQIDTAKPELMADLAQKYQYNFFLISEILKQHSLKQIQQDAGVIVSDAFNHVDIYHKTSGVSGTLGNHTTFHQGLHYDINTSLGSDEYIVELLRDKKTPLSYLDYEDPDKFVNAAFEQSSAHSHVRAIIDINATFTGIDNVEVARIIARIIKTRQQSFSKAIKQVVYFNDLQVLCALSVNNPDKPIILNTSNENEINQKLSSTPEERFTYYDQIHILGTDIKQFDMAHALILVDEKISFQNLIQGNMRMRGIHEKQTVELILPHALKQTITTLDALVTVIKRRDEEELSIDRLLSTKAQMTNVLRRTVLSEIQAIPSENAQEKAKKLKMYEPLFIEIPSSDLFLWYGDINKRQTLDAILLAHKERLLKFWKECYQKEEKNASQEDSSKKFTEVALTLDSIIDRSRSYCLTDYEITAETCGKEAQVQTELQVQVQKQVEAQSQSTSLSARSEIPWSPFKNFQDLLESSDIMAFKEFLKDTSSTATSLFSESLHVSRNYANTYVEQEANLNPFLKPIFCIWYYLERNTLFATIVTPQELGHLQRAGILAAKNSWIATTENTVMEGTCPTGIMDEDQYQILREQIRFFNGDILGLLTQTTPFVWLETAPAEKIKFFTEHLQQYHPSSAPDLDALFQFLSQQNTDELNDIFKEPFKDWLTYDWLTKNPNKTMLQYQIEEYKRIVGALVYLNENTILNDDLTLDNIPGLKKLPDTCLPDLKKHLKLLNTIKTLLERTTRDKKPFLKDLTIDEKQCLASFLNLASLPSEFIKPDNTLANTTDNSLSLEINSIKVLTTMMRHPVLKDYTGIIRYFENLASQVDTKPEILKILLLITPPLGNLIKILSQTQWFKTSNIFQQIQLTGELLELILDKITLEPNDFKMILQHQQGNKVILEKILALSDDVDVLLKIAEKNSVDKALGLSTSIEVKMVSIAKTYTKSASASTESITQFLDTIGKQEFAALNKLPTVTELLKRPNLTAVQLFSMFNFCDTEPSSEAKTKFRENLYTELFKKAQENKVPWEQLLLTQFNTESGKSWLEAKFETVDGNITPKLQIKILGVLHKKALTGLQIPKMIEESQTEEDLSTLINSNNIPAEKISNDQLTRLIHKCTEKKNFEELLKRTDLSTDHLKMIFEKSLLNGEEQLKRILSYTHTPVTKTTQVEWLTEMKLRNQARKKALLEQDSTNKANDLLQVHLDTLKIKAIAHIMHSLSDKNYEAVAKITYTLYQNLQGYLTTYEASTQQVDSRALTTFCNNCEEAIRVAQPVIAKHRGYKQIFLDIVNAILAVITIYKLSQISTGKWRFFKAETATEKAVNGLNAIIQQVSGDDNSKNNDQSQDVRF